MKKLNVFALIPARAGSKGVPGKNVRPLGEFPLIAYAICVSSLSKYIQKTIVSTDSEKFADVARKYGAEIPFLRPAALAQDHSGDLEVFQHAITWFKENGWDMPEFIVHLRPTTPLRVPQEIDRAIECMQARPESSSLRSVHELSEPPQKVLQLNEQGFLDGFFPNDPRPEYYNLPRQLFPKAYHPNGYVDIIKTECVIRTNSLHGKNILGFITPAVTEIDRPEDFDYLEYQLKKCGNPIYEYLRKNFLREDRYGEV